MDGLRKQAWQKTERRGDDYSFATFKTKTEQEDDDYQSSGTRQSQGNFSNQNRLLR